MSSPAKDFHSLLVGPNIRGLSIKIVHILKPNIKIRALVKEYLIFEI